MSVQALSGGMSARLFTEVREKRGLVYSVFAAYESLKSLGFTLCYAGTTPERSQETLDVLLAELSRLKEGVAQEEVDRGRTGLLSRLIMSGESTSARASSIASDYYLRGRVRSMDEIRSAIEAVTPDTVGEFLRKTPPANFTVVTLGPTELRMAR
jgi:predicted Zn-dependent peptidase